ncbi:MAG: protein kinase domain-containing protein [Planctomycetaceae bacterium]
MNAIVNCPKSDTLRRAIEQGGTQEEIDELAAHLEHCETCGETLEIFLANDPTVSVLRQSPSLEMPQEPAVRELLDRVRKLRAAVGGETLLSPIDGETRIGEAAAPLEKTTLDLKFLGPPEQSDELGRLGSYRILKQLGVGGMGIVFLAEDTALQRKVAIKTMLPALAVNPETKERFLREARAAAKVEHEHVIAIHQVGEDRGVPFLAMPLLRGEPLSERLQKAERLPIADVTRIAAEIAEGLAAAHAQDLIHRDIKPANIWLEGERAKVKLLDFGLARTQDGSPQLTQSGAILGTPAFMAPEQASGMPLDGRADLFSLGAVLYLMLTGQRPFQGANTMAVLSALALHNPPAPRTIRAEIPQALSDLTMQLLSKNPQGRPASAREVAQLLQSVEGGRTRESSDRSLTTSATKVVDAPTLTAPRKHAVSKTNIAIAAAFLASLLVALAVTVIRLQTATGELVLESHDEKIEVTIKQPGKDPIVEILDTNNQKKLELKAVNGEIEARELPDGLRFKTQHFELQRGEKKVFTAEMLLAKPAARDPAPQPPQPAVAAAAPPVYVETPEFAAWKTEVAALPAEEQIAAVSKKLKELNEGFDGKMTGCDGSPMPKIEDGGVTELMFLADKITNISPVRALAKLRVLECRGQSFGTGRLADLNPLQGMRLQVLRANGTQVRDLTPLQGLPLTGLDVSITPVSDLTPLKGVPLTFLLCGRTKVSDLSPLAGMPLEYLDCHECPIKDFSPLQTTQLQKLSFGTSKPEGQAAALETLRSVKTLEVFIRDGGGYAYDTPADVVFAEIPGQIELERVIKQLRELNPGYDGNCRVPRFEREQVTGLRIDSNDVTNLSPLRELKGLRKLDLYGVPSPAGWPKLSDISQLQGLPLTSLILGHQPIEDITPLKGMPLVSLNLGATKVKDLSPLKGMSLTFLHVQGSPVLDLGPLADMPLQHLAFTFRPDIKTEVLPSLKSLEMINNKPAKAFFEDLPVELEAYQAVQQLRELNRVDPRNPVDIKVEKTKIELLVLGVVAPADIEPLRPLKTLTVFRCPNSPMTDLKPLAGKPLKVLEIPGCRASDLSPLKGMPLTKLDIGDAPVTNLSPLAELPLIQLDFKGINPERDGEVLRSIKTLQRINGRPVADFWKDADKQKQQ